MRITTAKGPLTPTTLKAAGSLAMVSALLSLPMFLFSLQIEGRHDGIAIIMQILMQCMGTIIFMALVFTLRSLLVRNFSFIGANSIIYCLIFLNLAHAVLSCIGLLMPNAEELLKFFLPALIILLGIAQAGLGMRLFTLDNDLGGMKQPYCWLNIVTGVCIASLLLIVVGVIASVVADVMLGTIFLQEARRVRLPTQQTAKPD